MMTGQPAVKAARYAGICDAGHHVVVVLEVGEPFPPCGEPILGGVGTAECTAAVTYEILDYEIGLPEPGE
jgi:hypothetical protein